MALKNGYRVDFTDATSVGKVLGFNRQIYTTSRASEKVVDIIKINSILISVNIIESSYVNGKKNPVIYSFFPNVGPGYKISEVPSQPIYLPISTHEIRDVYVRVTDQDGVLLDNNGERIDIAFNIKEM
jgi:hypothetical protein